MKLKSKLIATIVSMCAAIAVMGVGVWASTSQNFTVTVNNDIDVKIINVNADVYGEFAVYTQFTGSKNEKGVTPAYAQKYGKCDTAITGYTSHENYDHGYLLYAVNIGINDGLGTTFDNAKSEYHANGTEGFGYNKFIDEAKNNVYLATSNGSLVNTNSSTADGSKTNLRPGTGTQSYNNIYNVDFTTHTAQIAYLYTIKQWQGGGATNEIFGTVKVNLSDEAIAQISGTVKAGNANVQIRPNLYIYDATSGSAAWHEQTFAVNSNEGTALFKLPDDQNKDNTYYVLLTFTFGRNNANLDMSGLSDAINHTLILESEWNEAEKSGVSAPTGYITESDVRNIYSATANAPTTNDSYVITGEAFAPSATLVATDQITGSRTADNLKNCFALPGEMATHEAVSHLPNGYIYYGVSDSNSAPHTNWEWLDLLNNGQRATTKNNGF